MSVWLSLIPYRAVLPDLILYGQVPRPLPRCYLQAKEAEEPHYPPGVVPRGFLLSRQVFRLPHHCRRVTGVERRRWHFRRKGLQDERFRFHPTILSKAAAQLHLNQVSNQIRSDCRGRSQPRQWNSAWTEAVLSSARAWDAIRYCYHFHSPMSAVEGQLQMDRKSCPTGSP
jgi:hypothetical protein